MTLDTLHNTLPTTLHTPSSGAPLISTGLQLRSLREAQDLSQYALAEQCGLDQPTISDWERGVHVPSLRSLLKLAEALQVPAARLMPEEL